MAHPGFEGGALKLAEWRRDRLHDCLPQWPELVSVKSHAPIFQPFPCLYKRLRATSIHLDGRFEFSWQAEIAHAISRRLQVFS